MKKSLGLKKNPASSSKKTPKSHHLNFGEYNISNLFLKTTPFYSLTPSIFKRLSLPSTNTDLLRSGRIPSLHNTRNPQNGQKLPKVLSASRAFPVCLQRIRRTEQRRRNGHRIHKRI